MLPEARRPAWAHLVGLVGHEEVVLLHLLDHLSEQWTQEQGREEHHQVALLVEPLVLVPPLVLPVVHEDLHLEVFLEERQSVVQIVEEL